MPTFDVAEMLDKLTLTFNLPKLSKLRILTEVLVYWLKVKSNML